VWAAERTDDGRQVALKVLGDPASQPRLRREAQILSRLRHPHIVRIRELTTTDDGRLVLVLDLVPGGDLGALVAVRGPLEPGEVVTVLTPLAGALAQVHADGLTHGDITPANVLFGDDGRPMLCDLGVARLGGLEPVQYATEGFYDIDRAEGPSTPADDIYALGALAWFALTARVPPEPALRPPVISLVPALPLPLAALIERCLSRDPGLRPVATELASAAFDAAPAEPVALTPTDPAGDPTAAVTHRVRRRPSAQPQSPPPPERLSLRRNASRGRRTPPRWLVGVTALIGLAVVAGLLLFGTGRLAGGDAVVDPSAAPSSAGPSSAGLSSTTPSSTTPSSTAPSSATSSSTTALPSGPSPSSSSGASSLSGTATVGGGRPPAEGGGAEAGPAEAVVALGAMRAQAFATGDGAMLQAADAAGSSALDADLAILKQLESSQVLLQGISFHVGDVTVLDESARVATLRLTAATGAHQVVRRDGSVVATVPQGPAAPVVITLVRGELGWQVSEVRDV
jgi:serine/threonine protein kinase